MNEAPKAIPNAHQRIYDTLFANMVRVTDMEPILADLKGIGAEVDFTAQRVRDYLVPVFRPLLEKLTDKFAKEYPEDILESIKTLALNKTAEENQDKLEKKVHNYMHSLLYSTSAAVLLALENRAQ